MEYRNENHNKTIVAAFQERFKTQTDCDVGLICDGRIVKAHRCIITLFSPFLKQLFDCQIPKQQLFSGNICSNIVFINYRYNHLMELLRYMYTGVLKIPREDAPAFVKCVEDLKIVGVLEYLKSKLNQDGDPKKRKISESDRPSVSADNKRVKPTKETSLEAKTKKIDSSVAKSGPQGVEGAVLNTQEQPKMDIDSPSSSQPPASSKPPPPPLLPSTPSSTSVVEDLLQKVAGEGEESKPKTEKTSAAATADVSKQVEPKESVKSHPGTVIEKLAVNNVQKESKSATNSSNNVEKTPQKVVGNTILQSISRPSGTPSQKTASDTQKSASSSKAEKLVDGDKTPKMRSRSDSDSSSKSSKGDKYRGADDGHKTSSSSSKSHSMDTSKSKNGTPSVSKHSDSSRSGHKSGDRKDREGESSKKSRGEDKLREKKDEDSRKDRDKSREKERDREKEKEKDNKSGRPGGSSNSYTSGSEKDSDGKSAVKRATAAAPEVVTLSPPSKKCPECGKTYPEGTVHKKVSALSSESNKCYFPECNKQMKFRRQVIDHLVKFHKVVLCEDN